MRKDVLYYFDKSQVIVNTNIRKKTSGEIAIFGQCQVSCDLLYSNAMHELIKTLLRS